jgi:hypothetical protein
MDDGMIEKIIVLFRLCLTAKEHGVPVWFQWSPQCDLINVFAYKDNWADTPPGEIPDHEFFYLIYNKENADDQLTAARRDIEDLIRKRSAR